MSNEIEDYLWSDDEMTDLALFPECMVFETSNADGRISFDRSDAIEIAEYFNLKIEGITHE